MSVELYVSDGRTYHNNIYSYIQFAHSFTVYVGLAQARPNNIWIASVHLVYVGLAQARPNYGFPKFMEGSPKSYKMGTGGPKKFMILVLVIH